MQAGDKALTLGMWPQKGISRCAGNPLLGNSLSGGPFHPMSKYSALRFSSHSRGEGVRRKAELEKFLFRRILIRKKDVLETSSQLLLV